MLLCVEMAIFAVMHLFAFPWREYDLSKDVYMDPVTAPGSGYSGSKPEYQGGWMGSKALLDTFNPWDIIKASARGARWMTVGYRHRHEDSSYAGKLGSLDQGTSIPGPNVTSEPLPAATELRKQSRGRADTYGVESSDRAGLLSHAQSHALASSPSPSPSRRNDSVDDHLDYVEAAEMRAGDLGMAPHSEVPLPSASQFGGRDSPRLGLNRWDTDTGYHAAQAAPSERGVIGMATSGQGDEWDHWAGARRDADQNNTRPPTYSTTEH